MNFSNEQLTKAKAAKSIEELLTFAKENGIELTEEEAKNYFEQWHKEGELADDELDSVAGGCDNEKEYETQADWDPDGCGCHSFSFKSDAPNNYYECGNCKHFHPKSNSTKGICRR